MTNILDCPGTTPNTNMIHRASGENQAWNWFGGQSLSCRTSPAVCPFSSSQISPMSISPFPVPRETGRRRPHFDQLSGKVIKSEVWTRSTSESLPVR